MMEVVRLDHSLTGAVAYLMRQGGPFVQARTDSDYWMYAQLFSSSCPVVLIDGAVVGAAIAFRSQINPGEIYVQDVITAPDCRRRGVSKELLGHIRDQAVRWRVARVYLTSEPANKIAQRSWEKAGYTNRRGDFVVDGVWVSRDFKGPGKHRAVYELFL